MTIQSPIEPANRAAPGIVKSVARTLQTLELFDEVRKPVNVVDVSKRLGYPQSSTSALLKSMVAMGYLDYNSKTRSYFPTDRVPLTGAWMNPALYREGALIKLLNAVMERSQQVVLLGARNRDDAQYIQVVRHPTSRTHHISLGTRRPLGTSGVGNALLATMPDTEVQRMFRRINAYRTAEEEPLDIQNLLDSLAQTRKKGYFVSTNRVAKGHGLIAMLLPQSCTDRALAIGIGAPTEFIIERQEEYVRIMREEIVRCFGQLAVTPAIAMMRMATTKGKIRAAGM